MDERTLAENTAKELLEKLGFSNATIATTEDEEKRLNIQIDVDTEDSGVRSLSSILKSGWNAVK